MSQKPENLEKNKPNNKFIKWTFYVLIALILEGIAIGGAYIISESKTKTQTDNFEYLSNITREQGARIKHLEQLPASVAHLSSNIAQNGGSIKLLEENFNELKEEVGNKKIEIISAKLNNISRRIESVEENKSIEALILSIALIIKENALYGRNYLYEAQILENMAKNQDVLKNSITHIIELNNKPIITNDALYNKFLSIAKDFSFEKEELATTEKTTKESAVSKSLKMIKETVAGINFDKVVIVKKDNKTAEQKILLEKLGSLVKLYHFEQAIDLIDKNPIFFNSDNKLFIEWYNEVKTKVSFDKAISKIISTELNVLREDIYNQKISNTDISKDINNKEVSLQTDTEINTSN